jgi:hypothetical protein
MGYRVVQAMPKRLAHGTRCMVVLFALLTAETRWAFAGDMKLRLSSITALGGQLLQHM